VMWLASNVEHARAGQLSGAPLPRRKIGDREQAFWASITICQDLRALFALDLPKRYWVTTIVPFSPCKRQWNPNVPTVVIATATSCALNAGMSPDS